MSSDISTRWSGLEWGKQNENCTYETLIDLTTLNLRGHVFAGATLPFGMAKAVADVEQGNYAGFASNGSPIMGFSSLHDSGTGGSSSLGNFPLFIHPSCPDMNTCVLTKSGRPVPSVDGSVAARPGYFKIALESGVTAEMTAAERATLFRFTLTGNGALNPVITVDGSDLLGSNGARTLHVDATTGRITGEGEFSPSFGRGTYNAYTCVDFRGAELQDVGVFNDTNFSGLTKTEAHYGSKQGAYARFVGTESEGTILARVGLSWLSMDRACENAEREIADWNFDHLVESAEAIWRKKLEPITIDSTGIDESLLRNFWSGVYRAFLSPQDYTGENPLWNSSEPYYDSFYCIWYVELSETSLHLYDTCLPSFLGIRSVAYIHSICWLIRFHSRESYDP